VAHPVMVAIEKPESLTQEDVVVICVPIKNTDSCEPSTLQPKPPVQSSFEIRKWNVKPYTRKQEDAVVQQVMVAIEAAIEDEDYVKQKVSL